MTVRYYCMIYIVQVICVYEIINLNHIFYFEWFYMIFYEINQNLVEIGDAIDDICINRM